MVDVVRRRSVRQNSHIPYLVSLPQCLCWVFYAIITPDRLQLLVTNLIGAALQASYVVIFVRFSEEDGRKTILKRLAGVGLMLVLLVLVSMLAVPKFAFIKVSTPLLYLFL
jgi:hypothetical protein